MNRYAAIFGIALIGISFYSIGPVICDELLQNACYRIHHTEHFYTVLPIFLPVFATGIAVFLASINRLRRPQKKSVVAGSVIVATLISVIVLYGAQPFFVEIDEIKKEYPAGEHITFGIRTMGFGNVCSIPHVEIVRIDRPWPKDGTNVVWSNDHTTGCIGPAQYKFFNHFWQIEEMTESDHLFVNETGKFELRASYGNRQAEKQFAIIQKG